MSHRRTCCLSPVFAAVPVTVTGLLMTGGLSGLPADRLADSPVLPVASPSTGPAASRGARPPVAPKSDLEQVGLRRKPCRHTRARRA